MAKTPLHVRLLFLLTHDPESRLKSNKELAALLKAKNPLSVSQALSKLHEGKKIRVFYTGELKPIRNIDVL